MLVISQFQYLSSRLFLYLCPLFKNMGNVETTKSSKSRLKSFVQLVIFVGLGVFFIWLSLHSLSKDDVKMIFQSMSVVNNTFSWCMLGCAALMALLADVARAERSKILLEPLGYNIRRPMAFYSVMVCYLANLALPRLGEVLRCSFLQRFEKVPFQKSLGTVLTERAVDILVWLVMLVIAIGMNTGMLNQVVIDESNQLTIGMWMEQKGLSVLGNYFIYIFLAFIVLVGFVLHWTRRWWMKVPFFVKVRDFVFGIWQGFISIKDLPNPWRYVFWTLLMWVFYFLGTYLCFFAFPYLKDIGPAAAFSVLTFSTIAFMVSQGVLGSYPLMVAGILIMYNISYTQGLAAGWVGWLLQTAVVLAFGFLSLILASFYKKTDSDIDRSSEK